MCMPAFPASVSGYYVNVSWLVEPDKDIRFLGTRVSDGYEPSREY